jgi:RNA polymerase sigma-70 factor (ECF subfamily)
MLRVREDDLSAFEELVARYQERLIRIMEHLGPGPDMAEDLAQEVFLRVYRARKRYEVGSKFSTWFFTIANNVAHNARRDAGRRREINSQRYARGDSSAGNMAAIAVAPSGTMPARRLDREERALMVRQAIASALNDRQRAALLLNKFEEMSHEEIGLTLGMSAKAVKSLLRRARVNLRAALEPYLDEGANSDADEQAPNKKGKEDSR